MSEPNNIVDHQSEQYRRGQVLGFTMAEIMLILLFLLLILLGDQISDLEKELEQSLPPSSPEASVVVLIRETLQTLQSTGVSPPDEDVMSLTEKLTLSAPETIQNLPPEETVTRLESEKDKLERENKKLKQQNDELLAQLEESPEERKRLLEAKNLQRMAELGGLGHESAMMCLEGCGGGDGPEACWGESINNPDYIYNVAMFDDRYYVVPDSQNIKTNQSSWDEIADNAKVEDSAMLSNAEFIRIFRRLRAYADREECVFHVRLFDYATSTKEIYKAQESIVERYVYKTNRDPKKSWVYGDISESVSPEAQNPETDISSPSDATSDFEQMTSASSNEPATERSKPLRVPILIMTVPPKYPRRAQSRGIEGSCTVEYSVTPDGTVTDVKVIEEECTSTGNFDKASIDAVSQYVFEPYLPGNRTLQTEGLRKTFTFKLQ